MPDLTKWVGKSSDGKYWHYSNSKLYHPNGGVFIQPYYCDRCGEEQATVAIDMYYNNEYWCQECCDKSGDSEPKYDAVTAGESYQQAHDDRQRLRGFKK